MTVKVEVAYASEAEQDIVKLELREGTTVSQAIEASGLPKKFPEIVNDRYPFGIYGKKAGADRILENNDRIEIYRPLKISPKEARRLRARLATKS
jgi:putative ubiquitin-RnfH superfamily antitoxin RatB of RatAB toxin-antitoxin module